MCYKLKDQMLFEVALRRKLVKKCYKFMREYGYQTTLF